MSIVETRYEHIVLNEDQVPLIAGTQMEVKYLAARKLASGWGLEEMRENYPFPTLGQICFAPAYYSDHREEMEAEIERDLEHADCLEREMGPNPLTERLRKKCLL